MGQFLILAAILTITQIPLAADRLSYGPNHYPWTEEINSEQVDSFVNQKNKATLSQLTAHPDFADIQSTFKTLTLELHEEIKNNGDIIGDYAYVYRQDDKNPLGVYLRMRKEEYFAAKAANNFENVLWEETVNIDEFVKTRKFPIEITNPSIGKWVCYYDKLAKKLKKCLVGINQSGGDRQVFYEYDFESNLWVTENSFDFEFFGKSNLEYLDENTLLVTLDGKSFLNKNNTIPISSEEAANQGWNTDAGSPARVYRWRRGEEFNPNDLVFSIPRDHMFLDATYLEIAKSDPAGRVFFFYDYKDFENYDCYLKYDLEMDNTYRTLKIGLPEGAKIIGSSGLELFFVTTEDWLEFRKQDILSITLSIKEGVIFEGIPKLVYRNDNPDLLIKNCNLIPGEGEDHQDDRIVVSFTKNVSDELGVLSRTSSGNWKMITLQDPLDLKYKELSLSYDQNKKELSLYISNFLTPYHKYIVSFDDSGVHYELTDQGRLKFDTTNLDIEQLWVDRGKDKDGKTIRVPYYIVYDKTKVKLEDNKNPAPTWVYAYGGFGVGLYPGFNGNALGKLWLNQGGVYVVANIRGGDEFGPDWYNSVTKNNRDKVFGDFSAVRDDLIRRGITNQEKLGIQGGSNGGLLVGTTITQHPDFCNGVLCEVPLLDMSRFNKLLVGATWETEYGNPQTETRDFWSRYSPLHQLSEEADYPAIFLKTNRNDDRVHPGHARKFSVRLDELSVAHFYFEDTVGGHTGAALGSNESSFRNALEYVYMYRQLGVRLSRSSIEVVDNACLRTSLF